MIRTLIMTVFFAAGAIAQDGDTKLKQDAPAKGGLILAVSLKGGHTNDQWNTGQEWPFTLEGESPVPYSVIAKLMPGEKKDEPVELGGAADFFAYFAKGISDKQNSSEVAKVTGKLLGKIKEQTGSKTVVALSGKMKFEWPIQGNTFWIEGQEIEGTLTLEGGKAVALEIGSKKSKTGGTWDWGGGGTPMGGKVSAFSIKMSKTTDKEIKVPGKE